VTPKTARACGAANNTDPSKSNNNSRTIVPSADSVKLALILRFLVEPDFKNFRRAFSDLRRRAPAESKTMNKKPMNKKQDKSEAAVASLNGNTGRGTPIKVPQPKYQLPPADLHESRCVGVIDIGTHDSGFPDGKKLPKVILIFELPNERRVFVEERGEEPFHQSKIYTNSLGEKSSLYKDLKGWKGEAFIRLAREDLGILAGEPRMLNITHEEKNGKTRAIIIGISPVPRGTTVPTQISPSVTYSISEGVAGGTYDRLPSWIQKFILDSEEIDGPKPSKAEIAERNVREATANAQAGEDDDFEERMNRDLQAGEAEGY
jgi:hypothetical protein